MPVHLEHERLVAQVVDKALRHLDGDVLDVVEAERSADGAASAARVVPDRLRGEGLILVMDEMILAEDVAVLDGNVQSVEDCDAEREVASHRQVIGHAAFFIFLKVGFYLVVCACLHVTRAAVALDNAALHVIDGRGVGALGKRLALLAPVGRSGEGDAGRLLHTARVVAVLVVEHRLDGHSEVPAHVALLVHNGHVVHERNGIQEAAKLDERPADEPEPREAIVERVVPADGRVVVGLRRLGGGGHGRLDGRRLGLGAAHLAHQFQPLAELVQAPVVDGSVLTVLHLDGHHGSPASRIGPVVLANASQRQRRGRRRDQLLPQLTRQRRVRSVRQQNELERHPLAQFHRQSVRLCTSKLLIQLPCNIERELTFQKDGISPKIVS